MLSACRRRNARMISFPSAILRMAGYHSASHGQKSYNGVAILSKSELHERARCRCAMRKTINRRA